jgi:methyl-accepting chemotaxis protein
MPIIIIAVGSLYYLWYIETTSRLLIEESSKITTKLADDEISNAKAAKAMMQSRANELTNKARWIALMVFGVMLLLVIIIVTSYIYRLTGKIRKLAEKAERIGSGEFEVAMETDSGDEIGDLKRAIAKMQNNIQLYIERLQQRQ